jgi:hypothetical protein
LRAHPLVRSRRALVLAALLVAALVATLRPAPAFAITYDPERYLSSTCFVRALTPLYQNGRVWGRLQYSGCGHTLRDIATTYQLSTGEYVTHTPTRIDPSENAVYYSLPIWLGCRRYSSGYKAGGNWYRGPSIRPGCG